ncbi:GHSR [Mytilus coruscus]|uniref:GHSR n=1 Tax=Mytilus coruscus TaxID=42192 RepID=A0A6J8BHX1_MYTCO|nr:GHSR [Mytilus coruscus]
MSNITVLDGQLTIDDFNHRVSDKLIAPLVFIILMLIIGIPGNAVVLIIYWRKYTKSVYRTIVWNLAVVDFSFCMIGIPFNINRVTQYYSFPAEWICVMFIVVTMTFLAYSSNLILLLSICRFRKICMPLKSQFTNKNIKYWVLVCFVIGFGCAAPQIFIPKFEAINLGHNLTGHTCAISLRNPSIYSVAYTYCAVTVFSSYTLALTILYSLIGWKVYRQRRKQVRESTSLQNAISSKATKVALTISIVFAISYLPVWSIESVGKHLHEEKLDIVFDNRFRQHIKRLVSFKWKPSESSGGETSGTSLPMDSVGRGIRSIKGSIDTLDSVSTLDDLRKVPDLKERINLNEHQTNPDLKLSAESIK